MITTALSGSIATAPPTHSVQAWWSHAAPLGEHFFHAVGLFAQDTPRAELQSRFEMLQAVRSTYSGLGFPPAASAAQAHLGAAMDQLLISFHYLLHDEITSALDYLHGGQNTLAALALTLDQLDMA